TASECEADDHARAMGSHERSWYRNSGPAPATLAANVAPYGPNCCFASSPLTGVTSPTSIGATAGEDRVSAEPRQKAAAPQPPTVHALLKEASGEPIVGKVLVGCTEDWFTLSHFKPLLRRLRQIARDVVVVARSSGRMGEIEAIGCRTIDFDYSRS